MTNKIIADRRLNNLLIVGSKFLRPEQVVQKLGALQAQDYMQVMWAIGLRTPSASLTDIERAIVDRKIILTWSLRGTIHCVPSEDVKWMLQLTGSRVVGQAKSRLAQLGLDNGTLERCREVITEALKGGRQADRSELLRLLEEAGISTGNQRGYHILWHCAYQGLICFGPVNGKQQTFVLLDEWVPHSREFSIDESLAELALRYFTAHGPATVNDFAWWAGMTLTDARRGLETVKGVLFSEQIEGREYWMSTASVAQPSEENSGVYLLPGFDEYILGFKDRSAVLKPETAPRIVPGINGVFLPTLVVDGQVIGIWKRIFKKKGIELVITPFEQLGDSEERVLRAAERYAVFVGLPLLKIDFADRA
ncbi:AlkZ family DNA glycosylase [Paenibacillus sp. 19GGS1-52]|uniref:winged helix DNA-binding domain-containing protein n=1 Tax=Paenibacillus sp. 19GGS1-52 TaxID=2758563 RepID=UPI001EFB6E8E|nr:winged helix DNA-binding domain-containing protein [Paenibacillus sp. 19GGS1-52]ULO09468.1 AlkZ family DNA glycosylase [Paenibacillus sp. 19GGS1-52]